MKSYSPKCYQYLRKVKKLLLPCKFALRSWVCNLAFEPGILDCVLDLMRKLSENLKPIEKLVALTFDEMHISKKLEIVKKHEQVWGLSTSLVVMCRGLAGKWKTPVYYNFK